MAELVAYGTYIPEWRLDLAAIAQTLGTAGRRGTRSVASHDEDSTSMAVEAGRAALAGADGFVPDVVLFATTSPAYLDKTNATALHAAFALPQSTAAYDVGGSARSAAGAMRLARSSSQSTLVAAADVRTGLPGGPDEASGGDAAVAFAFGTDRPALVETLAEAASSEEFLDRWREPGAVASKVWEERFGEAAYLPLAQEALTAALKAAELGVDAVDHLVVSGLHARAVRTVTAASGVARSRVADDLSALVGNPGAAQPGLVLADVLDRARAGETIVVVHLADGADVTVLRATRALEEYRRRRPVTVRAQLAAGRRGVPYAAFLTWRGLLRREPPRRPDPAVPAAPPSRRHQQWKFAFVAARCAVCATLHLPPVRVCTGCAAVDRMNPEPMAHVPATIVTHTVDHLTYSLAPPMIGVVVDFDGGGRFVCELADAAADEIRIGGRVVMAFRRLYTAPNGVHNYGWKARLLREDGADDIEGHS